MKVYCTHWSDHHQRWSEPQWISKDMSELGLPFGYFFAESGEEAKEFVKTLPPLQAVTKQKYYPNGFTLGFARVIEALFKPE